MTNLVEWGRNVETGVVYLIDPHVLIAFWCLVAAACVAAGLSVWLAIEAEMRSKK
jgi:hypothetical protein